MKRIIIATVIAGIASTAHARSPAELPFWTMFLKTVQDIDILGKDTHFKDISTGAVKVFQEAKYLAPYSPTAAESEIGGILGFMVSMKNLPHDECHSLISPDARDAMSILRITVNGVPYEGSGDVCQKTNLVEVYPGGL